MLLKNKMHEGNIHKRGNVKKSLVVTFINIKI